MVRHWAARLAVRPGLFLVFFLRELMRTYRADVRRTNDVAAIKPGTRAELYKRICTAKDMLHSTYAANPDLDSLSREACLSVPQLVRQFRSVFKVTPHQYLMQIRLARATELLRETTMTSVEIAGLCGFESGSAFGRAFKAAYQVQPIHFRKAGL